MTSHTNGDHVGNLKQGEFLQEAPSPIAVWRLTISRMRCLTVIRQNTGSAFLPCPSSICLGLCLWQLALNMLTKTVVWYSPSHSIGLFTLKCFNINKNWYCLIRRFLKRQLHFSKMKEALCKLQQFLKELLHVYSLPLGKHTVGATPLKRKPGLFGISASHSSELIFCLKWRHWVFGIQDSF